MTQIFSIDGSTISSNVSEWRIVYFTLELFIQMFWNFKYRFIISYSNELFLRVQFGVWESPKVQPLNFTFSSFQKSLKFCYFQFWLKSSKKIKLKLNCFLSFMKSDGTPFMTAMPSIISSCNCFWKSLCHKCAAPTLNITYKPFFKFRCLFVTPCFFSVIYSV